MDDQLTLNAVGVQVVSLTNRDRDFYPLLGPWLCRREIVNATGQPFWDDDGKTWVLAVEDGHPLGCVALTSRVRADEVCSLWVRPQSRNRGLGRRLVRVAVGTPGGRPARATATPESVRLFRSCGFQETGERGRYTLMQYEPTA
jgi:GNAT superfamily N-acetyltransferase